MLIPFADIKLHDKDRWVDAEATYDDAVKLAKEIEARWNAKVESVNESGGCTCGQAPGNCYCC